MEYEHESLKRIESSFKPQGNLFVSKQMNKNYQMNIR